MSLGYVIISKVVLCPLPSCFILFSWAASRPTILPLQTSGGTTRNNWLLGEKYCIISNPSGYSSLQLPCFLQHVQQQHISVNPLGQVTCTQCLLEVHLLVASLQGQLSFQGCLPLWELTLQVIWTETLTTLLLKLQAYYLDQISTPLLWNIWSVAFYHFVLKPLTNSYNQDTAPL